MVELERGTSGGTGGAGIGGRTGANLVRKISAFRLKRGEKTPGAKDVPGPSIPKGPRTQIMGYSIYFNMNGIWALKPYYLGPWTLLGIGGFSHCM